MKKNTYIRGSWSIYIIIIITLVCFVLFFMLLSKKESVNGGYLTLNEGEEIISTKDELINNDENITQENNSDTNVDNMDLAIENTENGECIKIILHLKKEFIEDLMCMRLGEDNELFELDINSFGEGEYALIYAGAKTQGQEYVTYMLNTKDGHIYENISGMFMGSIFYPSTKNLLDDENVYESLISDFIGIIPDEHHLFDVGFSEGNRVFDLSKKVNDKFESVKIYVVNPLTGAVTDGETDEHLGYIEFD